jgi:UDP:flavonoid glycosyltransferase YjiC (YdhE family)
VRILFSCVAGFGHLYPLLPLARALAAEGHAVAIATGAGMQPAAQAAGFKTFAAGLDVPSAFAQLQMRFPNREYEQLVPEAIMQWYLPHLFGEIMAPAMVEDLEDVVETWRPDLIVHETYEFGAPVIAAAKGIPSIGQTLGLRWDGELLELVAGSVAPLWCARKLEPDRGAGVYRHLCLDIAPPALQTDARRFRGDCIRALRPVAAVPQASERLPSWMASRRPLPLVYMTLGTNTNSNCSMFRSVMDGLADLDVEVLVATGSTGDPGVLGPLPDNAHVERWVAQSLVLQQAALVICHGGAGTTLGSLAQGVPVLVLPQGADQYIIGDRLVASGAGLRLLPAQVTAAAIRHAAVQLLKPNSTYRIAARQVQAQIAAMPSPEETVHCVENLA